MNTSNEYMPQDPRDRENQANHQEPNESVLGQSGPGASEESAADQEATPMDEDMTDSSRSAHDQDELIPITKEEDIEPGEEEDDGDEDQEDENDEEEEEGDEIFDKDDQEEDTERGRDTTIKNPGDEDSSPASNPYETNFEDPAQNRKTDPMTDHEPRIAGI